MHIIDVFIIIFYLGTTMAVGIMCRGRQQDADDYFTASGGMTSMFQTILVGLSIAATTFSGISLLAYPSLTYSTGVGILLGLSGFFVSWFILRFVFLPRYLIAGSHHPYEIIEKKLGTNVRTMAASLYVLLLIGWMAALRYAPTIAIIGAAGVDDIWFWPIVLIIGLSSTIYTVFGGIRGVIVTDAIQFVIIGVGLIMTLCIIITKMPVSFGQVTEFLGNKGHLEIIDFSTDPTKLVTFWTILIAFNVSNFSEYMADQMCLQRYIATGSVKAASKSFIINVIGVVIVLILLATIGLFLSAWYHYVPDQSLPKEVDRILPYFISSQMPVGISGLFLAAIIAATMSSMTSGINTLSASLTLDFRGRFGKKLTPEQQLRFGKICCCVVGFSSTLIAGYVGRLGTIFEMTQAILGFFLGPILACMFFAIVNFKVGFTSIAGGVLCGLCAGGFVVVSSVANVWAAAAGFFISTICTFLFSLGNRKCCGLF